MTDNMRDPNLQIILDQAEATVRARGTAAMLKAAALIFGRLRAGAGREAALEAQRLPVCRQLEAVYSGMAAEASPLPELASAFMAFEPRLQWTRRKGAEPGDAPFYDSHANATIIGKGGIEERRDVWVGVTLMAGDIVYPVHDHPPEEIYLAFTEGEWWNAEMDWTRPAPGGLIYNPPGIAHTMRSGARPFLALWMLPVDG